VDDIRQATERYEAWLAGHVALDADDLAFKHRQMADPRSRFPFLRATYYRWLERWPLVCPELVGAPVVLAVGDLHVENFGTWRDADGRLSWGVNDFDECEPLPYTQDLVRLAASAVRAVRDGGLRETGRRHRHRDSDRVRARPEACWSAIRVERPAPHPPPHDPERPP